MITATQDVPTGPGGIIPVPVEIERSFNAPNQALEVVKTASFTMRRGFEALSPGASISAGV